MADPYGYWYEWDYTNAFYRHHNGGRGSPSVDALIDFTNQMWSDPCDDWSAELDPAFVVLHRNSDGAEVRFVEMQQGIGVSGFCYLYEQHNYSCDCNRHLDFMRRHQPGLAITDINCGHEMYSCCIYDIDGVLGHFDGKMTECDCCAGTGNAEDDTEPHCSCCGGKGVRRNG